MSANPRVPTDAEQVRILRSLLQAAWDREVNLLLESDTLHRRMAELESNPTKPDYFVVHGDLVDLQQRLGLGDATTFITEVCDYFISKGLINYMARND